MASTLAGQTEKAVSAWLKASLQFSSLDDREREGLGFAIEMVSISAGYVIACAESKEPPTGKGLATYLTKKSTALAKMIDARPLKCIASVTDFGLGMASDGPKLVTAVATSVSGVTILLAIQAGLSLLLAARDVWTHCAPLVKDWVEEMRRANDLARIHREAMGKIRVYTLNYEPDELLGRTA